MKKKNNGFIKVLFLMLFILFLGLYFSSNAGLIDYQAKHNKNLTEKQIKQFEEDVKNNVSVDLNNYIDNKDKYYDNAISRTTLKISNGIGKTVKKTLDFLFKGMEKYYK